MIRWRTRFFGPSAARPRFTLSPEKSGAWPLWILAGIAIFAFAAYAGPVLIPLVAAIVLYYMFAPLKRRLARRGISAITVAIGVPLFFVVLLFAGFSLLAAPVSGWVEKAPEMVTRLRIQIGGLMSPVDKVREAGEQVKKMTGDNQTGTPEVALKSRGLVERVFGGLSDMVVNLAATLMLLFYLLLRPAPPERAFIGFLKTFGARRRAYRAVREAEADLSRYIGTITLINICLGLLLALSFHLVGLPHAGVLGATIAVLNYIPLLGALASFVLTLVAGLASFDTLGQAIVPPLIAAAFHTIETNFVTPAILGKRLTLDPFLVVLALLFGAWLWGIGGALLAVPILLFSVAAWRAYIYYAADRKKEEALASPAPAALAPPLGATEA